MTKIILFYSIVFYWMIAANFYRVWLGFLQKDYHNLSADDKQISWEVLTISIILWPIVVPISYLELLETKIKKQERC